MTSSYLQIGHLTCESPFWAFCLGALETSCAMSINVSKNMKICTTQCMCGKRVKMAWNDMYWEEESNKNNPQMKN
jgi:hypothetical protein